MKSELQKKTKPYFKGILIAIFFFEIVGCYYAYYTLGEVKQFLYVLVLSLNIVPLLLYRYRLKTLSFVLVFIIGLLLIPYQIVLVSKWSKLKVESLMLVEYIYRYQKENGAFPESISEYNFKNHQLAGNFSYYQNSNNFSVRYYIGTKGTTHFYYHKVGKWEYYPD